MIPEHVVADLEVFAQQAYDEAKAAVEDGDTEEALQIKTKVESSIEREFDSFTLLGSGVGRIVVGHDDFDDYCVKIAKHTVQQRYNYAMHGVEQNRVEADNYDRLPETVRERFVPVSWISDDNKLLVMPIVDTEPPYAQAQQFAAETNSSLLSKGYFTSDITAGEIGLYNNSLAVYDYGFPIQPENEFEGTVPTLYLQEFRVQHG